MKEEMDHERKNDAQRWCALTLADDGCAYSYISLPLAILVYTTPLCSQPTTYREQEAAASRVLEEICTPHFALLWNAFLAPKKNKFELCTFVRFSHLLVFQETYIFSPSLSLTFTRAHACRHRYIRQWKERV